MPVNKSPGILSAVYSLGLAIFVLAVPIGYLSAEPLQPPSISVYISELLAMQPVSQSRGGASMDIEVVHDAYLYYMAKAYEEIEDLALDEELLTKQMKKFHTKYKRWQKKLFFRVHISGSGANYVIFDQSLSAHLKVTQKSDKNAFSKRTFHQVSISPRVKAKRWKIMDPRGRQRQTLKTLFVFKDLKAELTSRSLRANTTHPIYFRLEAIRVQTPGSNAKLGGGFKNSINFAASEVGSQKSWSEWRSQGPTIALTPGRWEPPPPPTEFLNLLKKFGYK